MLITAWRIVRIIVSLLILTIGVLSLVSGERQLEEWRTGNARLDDITRTGGSVAEAPADAINRGNQGRLIHLVGALSATAPVDPLTGLSVPALRLRRIVEMYQWGEHLRNSGTTNSTTVTYTRDWNRMLIDSRAFQTTVLGRQKHENPAAFPYKTGVTFAASGLGIGPYQLEDGYLDAVDEEWKPVPAQLVAASSFAPQWAAAEQYVMRKGEPIDVGAIRIRYEYQPLESTYSVLGIQRGDTVSYENVAAGQVAAMLAPGRVDAIGLVGGLTRKTKSTGTEVRVMSGLWIMVGLMLGLRPSLLLVRRARGFTDAPALQRLGVTLLVSAVGAVAIVAAVIVS